MTTATVAALVGVAVLVISMAVSWVRTLERSERLVATVAALRGELDAARREVRR